VYATPNGGESYAAMKSRIIFCKNLWYSKKFRGLSMKARLFCVYLITNENIGLISLYKQHDLESCYILGVGEKELDSLKKEIEESGLYKFYDEWVCITNDFSYHDYFGRDRLMESKEKEISKIPQDVLTNFQGVFNPLITPYKPPINNKSEIINQKPEIRNQNNTDNLVNSKTIEKYKRGRDALAKLKRLKLE
jgi:hypothetical protein